MNMSSILFRLNVVKATKHLFEIYQIVHASTKELKVSSSQIKHINTRISSVSSVYIYGVLIGNRTLLYFPFVNFYFLPNPDRQIAKFLIILKHSAV